MSSGGASGRFSWPYARSPGSSTPAASTSPREGGRELWSFFWLALLNSAIIAVSGLLAWWIVHR